MSLKRQETKNINDLNAECFERLTHFLCNRDITALSIACGLWLKDIPLVYEDMANFKHSDNVAFMEKCGAYLQSFTIAKPDYSDIQIYEMHQLLGNYCTNITSVDVVLSSTSVYTEQCCFAFTNLQKLTSLALRAGILSPIAARHLCELKCLPQLESLNIRCTSSAPLDQCIKQCQQLKLLQLPICALVNADTLLNCKKLVDLTVTGVTEEYMVCCTQAKNEAPPLTFFEVLPKLQTLERLYLENAKSLKACDMLAIAQLPLLQHLTLESFKLCSAEPWQADNLLPEGALDKLEEVYFKNLDVNGCALSSLTLYLVRTCPNLKCIRLCEGDLVTSHFL